MPMAKMMLYAEILRQMRDIPNDYKEPASGELKMEYEEESEDDDAEQEPRAGEAYGRSRARS